LKTNRLGAVDWIYLAYDGDQFLALLNVDCGFRLLNNLWLSSTGNSYCVLYLALWYNYVM